MIFLTGFPGFLGSALVDHLLAEGESVTCLVQPAYADQARRRAEELVDENDAADDDIRLVEGDLTESEMGLSEPESLQTDTDEVYHLAAIYDLGVDREPAEAVNVEGTRRVLDFATAAGADRFHHVSTCYVSGRYDGTFGPDDFDVGQTFNNHYEATKFEAERLVRRRMADGLSATIYRPAIAVGDSTTGETAKFDGPYYMLKLLFSQPRVAFAPVHFGADRYELNLVPRDFVVAALADLSRREETAGETYQLCDPSPPTVAETLAAFERALDRRVVGVPLPQGVTRAVVEGIPGLADRLGVEPAVLDYLSHPTSYVCPNTTAALDGTDVACPPFASYADVLVDYARTNRNVGSDPMV
ncbi:SDR family oxidoreductase [Halobacteriales archaeon Cl-PHB]